MNLWNKLKFWIAGWSKRPIAEALEVVSEISLEALRKLGDHPPVLYIMIGKNIIPKPLDFSGPTEKMAALMSAGAAAGHFRPDYVFIVADGFRRETEVGSDEEGNPLDGILPSEMPLDDRIECLSFLCFSRGKFSHYYQDYKRTGRDFKTIELRGKISGPHEPGVKTKFLKDFLFGYKNHRELGRAAHEAKKKGMI